MNISAAFLRIAVLMMGVICATAADVDAQSVEGGDSVLKEAGVEIVVTENTAERRFDLTLISHDDRTMCVERTLWPTNGSVTPCMAGEPVAVIADYEHFPLLTKLCVDCFDSQAVCSIAIPPGGTLTGHLDFDQFDAAAFQGQAQRSLKWELRPWVCEDANVGADAPG